MILGLIITIIAVTLLITQLKKEHENRNVILLFFAFVAGLFGLWMVFDWIILKTWV